MDEKKTSEAKGSSTGGITPETRNASDTLSAAKISAGTSVGEVGKTPMPQSATGGGSGSAMGASTGTGSATGTTGMGATTGAGSATGTGAQSSTLASHTSKPLGGQAGATGAGMAGAAQNNEFSRHVAQPATQTGGPEGPHTQGQGNKSGGGSSAGSTLDSVKDMAQSATETASGLYDQAKSYARETYDQAADWASDQYGSGSRDGETYGRRSGQGMRSARGNVERFVSENPVMVGVIGLAAGLLLGALLPRSRKEDEYFGEWADEVREQGMRYAEQVREQGMQYAHEMTQRGRDYVESALDDTEQRFGATEGADQPQRGGAGGRYQSH